VLPTSPKKRELLRLKHTTRKVNWSIIKSYLKLNKFDYLADTFSDRLHYRLLNEADIAPWIDFVTDEHSCRFFPSFMKGGKPQAEKWIHKQLDRYANNQFGLKALIETKTNQFVGQCGLLKQDLNGEEILEIGYSLFREHKGKGYATEAAKHFKSLAKNQDEFEWVHSIIHVDNNPSKKVALANGMDLLRRTISHDIPVDVFGTRI